MVLMASKMLVYRPPWVDQAMARSMITMAKTCPIRTWVLSEVSGLIRLTISTATSVAELLRAAAMVLISAASSPAAMSPLSPVGMRRTRRTGRVWLASAPMTSRNRT